MKVFSSNDQFLCKTIGKKYGIIRKKEALIEVTLEFKRGEVSCVVGPNGAGKSTLLKIISGVIGRYSGELLVESRVSYVPENSVYFPNLTGYENLKYFGNSIGKSKNEILTVMKNLGLEDTKILAGNYSKGMKRKLDIAKSMLSESDIIVMDEPFDGLEPKVCDELISQILQMKAKGYSFIISSHELSRVQSIADIIFFMQDGMIKSQIETKKNTFIYVEFEDSEKLLANEKVNSIEIIEEKNGKAIMKKLDDRSDWEILKEMIELGFRVNKFSSEPLESIYRRIYEK
ncbi:MAG: ABC transporter related protein [Thermoplasmatales archaeon Gpl]|jgi:ABC-type multidrug transport system ATPase subunit|nr:MAG: ABC transporter related protein [Thermoplasmatales archaeon Gpl]